MLPPPSLLRVYAVTEQRSYPGFVTDGISMDDHPHLDREKNLEIAFPFKFVFTLATTLHGTTMYIKIVLVAHGVLYSEFSLSFCVHGGGYIEAFVMRKLNNSLHRPPCDY